jgi:hypothetical protein
MKNTLASSLTEIRARAAARFAADDTCCGISMMTFSITSMTFTLMTTSPAAI